MNKVYDQWLNYDQLDLELKDELQKMDESQIEEAFYKPLSFGTGGMRGIIGAGINRMNMYTLRKAAHGFAKFLLEYDQDAKNRGVAIAYDNRHKSEEFAKVCVGVLAAHGIKSFLFDNIRPTPLLSFAVRQTKAVGGIMVTASHNPPNYNGFKIYDKEGCQLVPHLADQVVKYVDEVEDLFSLEVMRFDEAKEKGFVLMLGRSMDTEYLHHIRTVQLNENRKKILKVIFTPLHGASREIGLRSLVENKFDVIPVEEQMVADPNFSTVKSPNPEDKSAFEYAVKYGRSHKGDLLIATDPDGDRLGIAVLHNNEYHYLTGNQTGAIFIDYILKNRKAQNTLPDHGVIYNTVVTSDFGAKIAQTYGVNVVSTLTGFKFIGEKMKEIESSNETFLMGYEESYGYVIKDFVRDKDSIQAMILASEIANELKHEGKTLIDYLESLYSMYGAYREDLVNISLEGKAGEERINQIMAYYRNFKPETFMDIKVVAKEDYQLQTRYEEGRKIVMDLPQSNVIKFILEDDSWFVLRPSGTEPKLKIYIALKEASVQEADDKIAQFKATILEQIDKIN
ncbi:phospho-sugar mutase [Liberiplasma polymorphum]|uniref:phospho-sugar mutase n=1 Tax=Liberiplasma polymorphum TaxID=3374570 RepID=UPI003771A177